MYDARATSEPETRRSQGYMYQLVTQHILLRICGFTCYATVPYWASGCTDFHGFGFKQLFHIGKVAFQLVLFSIWFFQYHKFSTRSAFRPYWDSSVVRRTFLVLNFSHFPYSWTRIPYWSRVRIYIRRHFVIPLNNSSILEQLLVGIYITLDAQSLSVVSWSFFTQLFHIERVAFQPVFFWFTRSCRLLCYATVPYWTSSYTGLLIPFLFSFDSSVFVDLCVTSLFHIGPVDARISMEFPLGGCIPLLIYNNH